MAKDDSKTPAKTEAKAPPPAQVGIWRPFESLRQEVDRLFDDFGNGFWPSRLRAPTASLEPVWRAGWQVSPAVDFTEKEDSYELSAELPGLAEKDIQIEVANGGLTIKGEKSEEKEEKKKDYHLQERNYGSFMRRFRLPEGVDTDKIEARFNKGVLSVMMPKLPEAKSEAKRIAVKST